MLNLWDIVNSISQNKKDLSKEDDFKSTYQNYMVTKAMSHYPDCILYANELNMNSGIDNDMHYSFLLNSIRASKRFAKWPKKVNDDDVSAISEYYGYNRAKAESALSLLSEDQLKTIKQKLERGGVKNGRGRNAGRSKAT